MHDARYGPLVACRDPAVVDAVRAADRHAGPAAELADDRRRALALVPVSRETEDRLAVYAELLGRWQRIKNLVAPSTLPEIWTRHIADSAQIVSLAPEASRWVDIGAGAGFPGLVVAILLADVPGAEVHLVEANARKCAFLREAARACAAPAVVHNGRIEDVLPTFAAVDVLTARALAPLPRLLEMGKILLERGTTAIFLKSRAEIADVSDLDPEFTAEIRPSVTSPDGRIVLLRSKRFDPAEPQGPRR